MSRASPIDGPDLIMPLCKTKLLVILPVNILLPVSLILGSFTSTGIAVSLNLLYDANAWCYLKRALVITVRRWEGLVDF